MHKLAVQQKNVVSICKAKSGSYYATWSQVNNMKVLLFNNIEFLKFISMSNSLTKIPISIVQGVLFTIFIELMYVVFFQYRSREISMAA